MIRRPLNNGWEFTERFDDSFLRFEGDGAPVRLPHTCRELPLHYADERDYQMVCGYRRTLELPAEWSGKRLFLTLDGAAHQATVFVNGKEAASHFCGYTAFTVELTGLVSCGGTNQIAVRLDTRESLDQPPFGHVIDYMTFGGLYREVWLDVAEQAYIADMFVRTPSMEQALVDLAIEGGGPADAVSLSDSGTSRRKKRLYRYVRGRSAASGPLLPRLPIPAPGPRTPPALHPGGRPHGRRPEGPGRKAQRFGFGRRSSGRTALS